MKNGFQNPESRSQNKRKTKSVEVVSAFSFWILNSGFWILLFLRFFNEVERRLNAALRCRVAACCRQVSIERRRFVARDAQGLPLCCSKMFRQKNDLADVLGVVRQLAIDRLDDR